MIIKPDITYWRKDYFKGVETCEVKNSRHVFPSHIHDDVYLISAMENGCSYCLEDWNEKAYLASGECAFINPGMVHTGNPLGGKSQTYRMVYIEIQRLEEAAENIFEKDCSLPEFHKVISADRSVYANIIKFTDVFHNSSSGLEIEDSFYTSMAQVFSKNCGLKINNSRYCEHKRISAAKEMLSENLDEKITLDDISKELSVSKYHFLRMFKESVGVAPHAYRNLKRVERAKTLLKSGHSAADTALMTGFNDQSHFTKKFREIVCATPGQYSKACSK